MAISCGYQNLAEDFSQDLACRYLEGKSHHQTLNQSFIDYLRSHLGKPKTARHRGMSKYKQLSKVKLRVEPIEPIFCTDIMSELLNQMKKPEVFRLYFIEDWTVKEMSEYFDISMSSMSHRIKYMNNKIRNIICVKTENNNENPL